MKQCLLHIWQFPQHLVALALKAYCGKSITETIVRGNTKVYFTKKILGGVSLGNYVFLTGYWRNSKDLQQTIAHELGHTKQSLILGPLYLFIIGLPSLIHAAFYNPNSGKSYYSFYTEKWADKLSNIKRS